MAAWQGDRTTAGGVRIDEAGCGGKSRHILDPRPLVVVERPGIRAEELLGKASEILEVFLGANAAEAVKDDVLRGLDWTGTAGETCR